MHIMDIIINVLREFLNLNPNRLIDSDDTFFSPPVQK